MTEIHEKKKPSPYIGAIAISATLGGLAIGSHLIKQRAAAEVAAKAAQKSGSFLGKITSGLKNITSPRPATGTVGLIGAAAAAFFYRDKLGHAVSKITGNFKNVPSQIFSGLKNILPSRFNPPETPLDESLKKGRQNLKIAKQMIFSSVDFLKEGLNIGAEVADKLNPIKKFLT